MKLVGEAGNDISDYDVRGELCVRAPNLIMGYLDKPEANARDWDEEGYFHSGDVGYCYADSKIWYTVDRKKELIKAEVSTLRHRKVQPRC